MPPVYSTEMNLSANMLGYFRIGVGKIGVDKIGGAYGVGQWTVLQTRMQSFTSERGRQDELSGVSAGSLSVLVTDDDGALDPDNTASPYYPNVDIARQVRVLATWAGVTYGLGYGFVDSLPVTLQAVGADVSLGAHDLFARLNRRNLKGQTFPQQSVGARITAILDLIQWPPQQRAIDATTLTVPAVTFANDTMALAHIGDLARAEFGTFVVAGDGTVKYLARVRRITGSSRGTFGAGGLPIRRISPVYDDNGCYNDIHVKRSAGVEQIATDAASQQEYDVRSYSLSGSAADQLPTDTDANAWANWVLGFRSEPVQRIASIEIDPEADPTNLWPQVLGAEVGDRITITHDAPGTKGLVAQDYMIESVRHAWSPLNNPEHVCTWGLSKAQPVGTYMVIGVGKIGVGKLAY
jgi:hypothetical protein